MGLSTAGSRDEVLARLMHKLQEKKPLNEDTMIVDADGVPRTPSRPLKQGDHVADGGAQPPAAGGITTTTVDRAGKEPARLRCDQGVVAKSSEGKGKKDCAGDVQAKGGLGGAMASVDQGPMRLQIPVKAISGTPFGSTNGFPTMSMTGIGMAGDMPQSPAFFAPPATVRPVEGVASAAFRAVPTSAKDFARTGNPAESVDARGGGRRGMDMNKIFHELAGGGRVLSPSEYEACVKALSDSVVANADAGAAALLGSKGGPGTSGVKAVGARQSDKGGDGCETSVKGPSVAKGPSKMRPPQVPTGPLCAAEASPSGVGGDGAPANQAGGVPVRNQGTFKSTDQRDSGRAGRLGAERNASESRGKLGTGEHGKSSQVKGVQPALGKDDARVDADTASERNLPTPGQPAKLHDGGQSGTGQASRPVDSGGGRDGGQQKGFVFNLNTVADDNRPKEATATNPFRGAFSGAAGGPDLHNTIRLKSNGAASSRVPRTSPTEPRRGSKGDFNIPASLERTPPLEANHREGAPSRDEQGFATPQEILRSFNRYGPDSDPGREETQALRDSRDNEGPESGAERFATPTSLPRHLRGFSSMNRPGRSSYRSSLRVTGSASGDGVGTLSSFRPKRPVSTASAGIFVNLRNSDLAPENKHMAEKLRRNGSLNERASPSDRLPGSSMRILHELKRIRAENRSMLSTKRNISPMPVPPSVAKRARLVGEFDKSALRRDTAGGASDRMQDVDGNSAVPAASTPSQPLQASSSVYPTTPIRPPARLKALPLSMKKRKLTAFGSGRKRPKSSRLTGAVISEMESQIEQRTESQEESLNLTGKKSPSPGNPSTGRSKSPGFDDKPQSPEKTNTTAASELPHRTLEQSNIRMDGSEIAITASQGIMGPISGKRKASSIIPSANTFATSSVDQVHLTAEHPTAVDDSPVSKKKRRAGQSTPDKASAAASGTAENSLRRVSFGNVSDTAARPVLFSFGGKSPSPTAFGALQKVGIPNSSETLNKASSGDPKPIPSIGKAFGQVSDNAGAPSNNAASKLEAKEEAAAKSSQSHVTGNNAPSQIAQLSDKPSDKVPLQTTAPKDTPILPFGQPSSSATQGMSAYDVFKNQTSRSSSLDVQKSAPDVSELNSGPSASQAKSPAFSPGESEGPNEAATSGIGGESLERKIVTGAAIGLDKTELEKGKPTLFGVDPQGSTPSPAFSLPLSTAALGTSSSAGVSFGAQIDTAEPQSGVKPSQGASLDSAGSAFKVPTVTAVTATREKAAGSMFAAPNDKLFPGAGSQGGSDLKTKTDQRAAVTDQQQSAPSIFSGTNAATRNMNSAPQELAPQSSSARASEVTGTAAIFGASSSPLGGAAVGFTFGSAAPGGEPKKQLAPEATAPNVLNTFGIKKVSGSDEQKAGGDVFKSSPILTPAAPLFGQAGSHSAATSQDTAEVKQPLVFGQTASMPSVGSVGNIQGGAQPFPQTGTGFFSGTQNRGIEKTAAGPFRGPQFKPSLAAKPTGSTFVFGANTSQQQTNSIANPLGGAGGNSGTQPSAFTPVPAKPAVSFGNPQPTFGAPPSFGAAPASPGPLGQPFGSLPQPAPTPASVFGQTQLNAGGANRFGTTPPTFGAPPAQTPPSSFGGAPMAIPNPSFGGFGLAGNQQPANPGGSGMMGAPPGNQSQFGAGFGKPVFGAPNPQSDSTGGFNMGAQQAPSGRRARKYLRAKRINR